MQLQCLRNAAASLAAIAVVTFVPAEAGAHCDSLDGPVVQDARLAFDKGDPTIVLKWVSHEHESEIRDAFSRATAARGNGDDAKTLAERHFFETLVRIHRAGEGEAFTGLKPASNVDPGIAAADKALQSGSAKELAIDMSEPVIGDLDNLYA